jgi:steroid 5-alpha reductase family enzyme
MLLFLAMFAVALVFSSIGFKKYVWFISIGYGFSVAAIGVALLIVGRGQLTAGTACACGLLVAYGLRLGGYLTYRELRSSSYNSKMKNEIKSGDGMSMVAKCAIWISAALLYACETSPVIFRFVNGSGTDALLVIGMVISVVGLIVETAADLQKNAAKKKAPYAFVSTGLFSFVRCPNYLGEMIFWLGMLLQGSTALQGFWQWALVLLGYALLIYIMFSGARRLEIRQNRNYGKDPAYQRYVKTVPILIPFVPLYSVEKHRWLVA